MRELDNAVQRALILQSGRELTATDFQLTAVQASDSSALATEPSPENRLSDAVRRIEFERILQTLRDSGDTRESIVKQLGISPRTLRYKLARMREMGYAVPSGV